MLKGKIALVTGSTSGIGLAIAKLLAGQGADIVVNGLGKPEQIEAAKAEVAALGTKVSYDGADLTKAAAIREMFGRIGDIDILVNNAGIQFVAPIQDFPDEKWEQIIALNLSAAFYATKAALPGMIAKKWGRVINISSAHGLHASPFKSAYVAAKHGIIGFTKVTALEVAEQGITSNAICPGYVHTPLVENQIADQMKVHNMTRDQVVRDVLLERQATKQFATVDQIAQMALYLCSPAADQITGTAISIDGGWSAI